MNLNVLNEEIGRFLASHGQAAKGVACGVPGLIAFEADAPSQLEASLYRPIACLTLQGAKEVRVGRETQAFPAGETVIVSHDLPVLSRVTHATPEQPYRALVLMLDLETLRGVYDQIWDMVAADQEGGAIHVGPTDPAFAAALGRYLALRDDPIGARVLGPLLYQEMHFHLLRAPHGQMLRNLLTRDSHASRINRAVSHLRTHYNQTIAMSELASIAGMSSSSFSSHFRNVTQTTPLQFQKELRLIEARKLMVERGRQISAVAHDVGYESAAQFSRDYARKFGASPRADLRAAMRALEV